MAYTHGNLTEAIQRRRSRAKKNGDLEVTIEKIVQTGTEATYTPALNSSLPGASGYYLDELEYVTNQNGTSTITLKYLNVQGTDGIEVPETTYEESTSQIQASLGEHPDFFDTAFQDEYDAEKDQMSSGSAAGAKGWIAGSLVVTKTEYSRSSLATYADDVGKRKTPGGVYTSSGKWLLISCDRGKTGPDIYFRKSVYQFSAKGWPDRLYSDA